MLFLERKAVKRVIAAIVIIVISAAVAVAVYFGEKYITKKIYCTKYEEYVERYSEEYGVPREIIYAVIKCESSFVADARSEKGAVGLMQIMPSTYEWMCTKTGGDHNAALLYDPETNIKYGTWYLSYLHSKFGAWETVYAAYNAGEGTVRKWLADPECSEKGILNDIPYAETEEYVKKVSKAVDIYTKLIEEAEHGESAYVPVEN